VFWTPLIVKALNPADMPTCFGGWNDTARYQVNDLVGIESTN
jgi:hypothetical protein